MKVAFFDFELAPKTLKQEWQVSIDRVLQSGRFIGGDELTNFENKWAEYLGIGYAVGVGNGLDAITLGLKALEIGSGAKVAVPSHTFAATWLAVMAVGAEPIGIDSDEYGLMDLDLLECSPIQFDAVIPVHMHGQMVDMPRLCAWAQKKKTKIIEDCAQAHGAKIGKKFAGTWGQIGAFSFYPTKNLGALGDGGAIVTDDLNLAARVRSLGNYGSKTLNKYEYSQFGVNSRLDPIQAAVLSVNLRYLDEWNNKRREIAEIYSEVCRNYGIRQLVDDLDSSVWHHFIILSKNRGQIRSELAKGNIFTEIHYPESAEDTYNSLSGKELKEHLNARNLARQTLSLPISPWMDRSHIDFVLKSLKSKNILQYFQE
jgi:dTDP-4-amino-4,6-dideoxygalactose transaminase